MALPVPMGFALIVEPVDREGIEKLADEMKTKNRGGFNKPEEVKYEETCLLRVVAAGSGVQYEQYFVPNHLMAGDIIRGTFSNESVAKDFSNAKECWVFDGKRYLVFESRDYHGMKGPALFLVDRPVNYGWTPPVSNV